MQVTGLSFDDFRSLVARVSADDYDGNVIVDGRYTEHSGNRFNGRIRTRVGGIGKAADGELAPGSRRSASAFGPERRLPAACWHAYRDVLAELFIRFPAARVKTIHATYKGAQGFLDEFPDTAYHNVGAPIAPTTLPETCDCSGYSEGNYVRRLRERTEASTAAS